jgi:hypothetical protein
MLSPSRCRAASQSILGEQRDRKLNRFTAFGNFGKKKACVDFS